jgi:MFS family permease
MHSPQPPVPEQHYRRGLRWFRVHAALTFAFAWVPVMYTAFTVDRGYTPAQYLQLWSAYYLAMVTAELPWGWVADRWGQRRLLVLGPLWLAACFVALGETDDFGLCWLLMAATGAGHAMISGADSAYLYELLTGAGHGEQALSQETVAHRWRLFGVSALDVAGGFAAHAAGTRWAFHLGAVAMLGAALAAACLPPTGRVRGARDQPTLPGLVASLRLPGVGRVLAWYVAVFVLLRVGFQLYQPTLLARGASDLRLHGLAYGALNLVAGLSAFGVMAVHARLGERALAAFVLLLLAVSFAGAGLVGTALLLPLFCLQQVGFGFLQPVGRTALNRLIPGEQRASLLSAQSLLARLAFGALLATGLWDAALGPELDSTYLALAALSALLALVFRFVPLRA